MDGMIKRYKLFLYLGLLIVVVSFFAGMIRTWNEITLFAFDAADLTDAHRAAETTEALLMRYSEIVPLLGLGFLKLGIGFAIATIAGNLKATGDSAGTSLEKVNKKPPDIQPPTFARIFSKMLLLGIIVELVAVLVTALWMITGLGVIDLKYASLDFTSLAAIDHVLEILAEPIEGLGVALLIGGIAFGLATIVLNLSRQATIMPKVLTSLATGAEAKPVDIRTLFPRRLLMLTTVGILITASGLLPIALIRIAIGDTNILLRVMWETWMFVGIAMLLFSIAFWLLTIIKWLRAQRANLGDAIGESSGISMPAIEPPLGYTKGVSIFAVLGLLWMLAYLVLSGIVGSLEASGVAVWPDIWWKPLVRPGKAFSLALIFTGIGLALMTIVVNLRLTSLMLPGAFSRIVAAIKGDPPSAASAASPTNLGAFAPKKLFLGIIIGVLIAFTGALPVAWIRAVTPPTDVLKLMLEHFIGPWIALGIGLIFFFIGMFFSLIVTFVKGRRVLIGEGVETCVYYALEKSKQT
ncbi:MAG: hypothetical protein ACXAEN_03265 [Candidatus Thorarchaeota archaeon]|jgi:hypothetical protein